MISQKLQLIPKLSQNQTNYVVTSKCSLFILLICVAYIISHVISDNNNNTHNLLLSGADFRILFDKDLLTCLQITTVILILIGLALI
jgi:hypothetical protein